MKTTDKILICILIFAVLVLGAISFYGKPSRFGITPTPPFIELSWEEKEPPKSTIQPTIFDITIDKFESRQNIYQPDDTARVDFEITNTLNVPYNISVDWLYNNTRYHGWTNASTEYYNTTQQKNYWYSSYIIQQSGNWEAHLVLKYVWLNQTFSKDQIATFKVI